MNPSKNIPDKTQISISEQKKVAQKSTICLNEKHWEFFDRNCVTCTTEVKDSGLLNDSEYDDWLEGKFTLGFKIKMAARKI